MQRNLPLIKRMGILLLMSLCLAIGARAQTTINGKITSSDDKLPVIGASVKIKNGPGGTTTDASGAFALSAPANAILVVSFVGYQTMEVPVAGKTTLSIVLVANTNDLTEVVVTGYTSQRRKDLTGAVAVVNVASLKAQPAASVIESLQGKATGVSVVSDGAPGSTPQIRVRGTSTIGNNEPLYIIDGVPFQGKLSWLNQNDVESMQILKDGSSASIYGSRANNGVVIITTKKGTLGTPKITFDSFYGIQTPRKSTFPKMMSPIQYAQYLFDGYNNAGQTVSTGTNYGTGPTPTLPEYLLAGSATGQNITAADADPAKYNYTRDPATFYQITRANQQGTNWFNEITESAPSQSYQISATGGGENSNYALSGGYLDQKGTIKHTGFTRYNFRSNIQVTALDKKFRFGTNASYSYSEGYGLGVNPNEPGSYQDEGSAISWAYRIPTIIPVYDIMGNFAGSKGSGLGNAENPLASLYRAKDNLNRSNFFFGNAYAEYDIIPGLTARTNFGIRYENYNGQSMRYPNLEFLEGNNSNNLAEYQGYTTEWTWSNTLNYKKVIEKHSFNLLAGVEAIRNRNRQLDAGRNDFFLLGNPDYYYLTPGASNISNASTGRIGSLSSLFAKADYSYNDRYLASFTIRRDGSSNFGPENKYGVFPAGSVAWRISEEDFMKDSKLFTDLKIRFGYGETGNQSILAFNYLDRLASSISAGGYPYEGKNGVTSGVYQIGYGNPQVKWESLRSLNLGVDFTLNGGTFDGSIDVYDKRTSDMLYIIPRPSTAVGMGASPFVNAGDMSNKGFEISLGYHYGIKDNKEFKFDVAVNFSRNVNKVLKLADGISQQPYGNFRSLTTSILRPGEVFGAFYGYKVAGIYQNAGEISGNPSYTGARVGGLRYQDIDGDGAITPADRTIIGDPNPDFIYSLGLNASYKNFDIFAFFNGVQGNDLYEATRYFTDFPTFDGARSTRLLDAWSPTNTSSMVPSSYVGVSDLEYASSSYYVQNGSFLRMKNLQLGYNLPAKALGTKLGLSKVRIYVSATNLFTITKYTGLDPEVSQEIDGNFSAPGIDRGIYPSGRQYQLGVSVGF
ncbi:SusC/RagA family TonB-linked outer membrane protein [Pedobacter sp. AW31-3R]|uniref:SusC/RagA family TonB-linked outer membrane protein n=1 Tax=Pedobacter sp. AW31-3R TaxID=3445781 RepID=UPI003F9FBD80